MGIESTVVDISGGAPVVLRPGMIHREELEEALGVKVSEDPGDGALVRSPGTKYRHYRPDLPLLLVPYGDGQRERAAQAIGRVRERGERVCLLAPERFRELNPGCFYSFGEGTAVDYARGLYSAFREFTAADADVLVCTGIAGQGAGLAVMNRLVKSATEVLS